MTPATCDLSCFFESVREKLTGAVRTYVDDTLCAGDPKFEEDARKIDKKFVIKGRQYNNFTFAGMQVEKIEDG